MSIDPNTVALAVNSVVSANLAAATVTVNEPVQSPERCPQVNVLIPGFELMTERIGAPRTEKRYTVPVECWHWGDDSRTAWANVGGLVNSVSAIFQATTNRTMNGVAEISRLAGGEPLEAPNAHVGVFVGYRLNVEVETLETN